jgi:uncharacterized RDD family membrane protein YckC
LQPSDFGWTEDLEDWKPLSDIPGLILPVVTEVPLAIPSGGRFGRKRRRSLLSSLHFAGFRLRWIARLVDSMLLFLLCTLIDVVIANVWMGGLRLFMKFGAIRFPWQLYVANFVMAWIYFAAFEASPLQATPGKRLLNLRVINPEGERASILRTLIRYPSKVLSLISIVGYPMVFWTRYKRALHDFIAGTYVIRDY